MRGRLTSGTAPHPLHSSRVLQGVGTSPAHSPSISFLHFLQLQLSRRLVLVFPFVFAAQPSILRISPHTLPSHPSLSYAKDKCVSL